MSASVRINCSYIPHPAFELETAENMSRSRLPSDHQHTKPLIQSTGPPLYMLRCTTHSSASNTEHQTQHSTASPAASTLDFGSLGSLSTRLPGQMVLSPQQLRSMLPHTTTNTQLCSCEHQQTLAIYRSHSNTWPNLPLSHRTTENTDTDFERDQQTTSIPTCVMQQTQLQTSLTWRITSISAPKQCLTDGFQLRFAITASGKLPQGALPWTPV